MKLGRVFVTGAGGFIGSHLTEELVSRGYTVSAFVHYNSLNRWGWLESLDPKVLQAVDVIPGDIRDSHGVMDAMRTADAVINLAALIGIPYSYDFPASYVDTNVRGTLNILQAAHRLGVRKLIHTSTSEVYGTARFVPITEEHPVAPQSPYAATKAGADALALSFYCSFGLPISIIRPFNTYGPRQSARAIIPTAISQVLSGAPKLRLGDTTPTRDFTYVKDTVKGFVLAMESERAVGQVINLASNREISIRDLVGRICTVMRVESPIESDTARIRPEKSEVKRLWGCSQKAKTLLNWEPVVPLEEGLFHTVEWFRSSGNLHLYKSTVYSI